MFSGEVIKRRSRPTCSMALRTFVTRVSYSETSNGRSINTGSKCSAAIDVFSVVVVGQDETAIGVPSDVIKIKAHLRSVGSHGQRGQREPISRLHQNPNCAAQAHFTELHDREEVL